MNLKQTNFRLFTTLRNYNKKNLPFDILTGIIIAAVSIPISMGYAQIAGLPAVYGLYGSVFPILFFAIFSTSRQFVFGVDAAPAALIGGVLISLGIPSGSTEAMKIVPLLTFFTATWLLLFFLFGAGKLVNYISTPVMGGFISGICTTIIMMQIPKLYGASSGTGEFFELASHILKTVGQINVPSLVIGLITLVTLILSKKLIPKVPMAVIAMIAGAVLNYFINLEKYGIVLLSNVSKGLPDFIIPDFTAIPVIDAMGMSLSVAIVIMAETLLAENNFALRNGYKLNDNFEILAFSLGNYAAAFTGCCPINGSVSRTSMSEQYGGKTQLSSIVAGISMIMVLLFGTDFIGYLPVPVLTAIVISALMGATEFHLAKKLLKISRNEFYIFCAAFLGVLVLGTIYGVLLGVILSFASVIIEAADPPRSFLGIIPGQEEFLNIETYKHTYPIEHVVIYKFNSNLFFANIAIFQNDIEQSIKKDTKAFIIDASGIGSIDVTAAERLDILYKNMKKRGIRLYITEHIADLNEQFRALGIGYMIEEGAVRRTIHAALTDMGIFKPYPIVGVHNSYHNVKRKRTGNTSQEFVWAFGDDADSAIEKQISHQIQELKRTGNVDSLVHGNWNKMGTMDEDEWLEHLEAHMSEIAKISGETEKSLTEKFENRRFYLSEKISSEHPELVSKFKKHRELLDANLQKQRPDLYEKILKLREDFRNK